MAIFKRGDKVRVIENCGGVIYVGEEGIINEDDSTTPYVKFSDCEWAIHESKLVSVLENEVNNHYEIF